MNVTKLSKFDSNLVLWLRMQEGPNTVAFDYSGSSNHGIISGAVFSPQGLIFNGTSDNIICGNPSNLNITTNITIDAWIYLNGNNTDKGIISKWITNTGYILYINALNTLRWQTDTASGGNSINYLVTPNTYYYVAATFNGTNIELFINAVSQGTHASTLTATADPLYIGRYSSVGTYFKGTIDEVRISNIVRSVDEINSIFQSTRNKYGV